MSVWYCVNCMKPFHHQGVSMHRRTHRDKRERVVFMTERYKYTYDYRGAAPEDREEES